MDKLALDEALITVNSTLLDEPLNVYYQLSECFGCKLELFKSLSSNFEQFVISTKHKLFLELRKKNEYETNSSNLICKFDNLDLNHHGHYKIELLSKEVTTFKEENCSFTIVDKGSCLLCPIIILFFLIFVIMLLEKMAHRLWSVNRWQSSPKSRHASSASGRRLSSQEPEVARGTEEQQQQHHQEGTLSNAIHNDNDNDNNNDNGNENETGSRNERQMELDEPEVADQAASSLPKKARIESLDAFRGLTIAGMIMVNYGGAGYSYLEHAAWNGLTLADLVFPFFIFAMGASIAISVRSMVKRGLTFFQMIWKIIERFLFLMLIGICLNSKWLNGKSLYYLRLTGVLQRFSISYLIIALMFTTELVINRWVKLQGLYRTPILSKLLSISFELMTTINHLTIYVYFTFYFEYSPTCPPGYVGPGGQTEGGMYENCTGGAAAWLDRLILGENHLYNDHEVRQIFKTNISHDPEGLLGNTTSILLTLIGLQCGKILLKYKNHKTRLFLFSQWLAILLIATALVILIPINKRLWSLTFIIITACLAYAVMIFLYLILDVLQWKRIFLIKLLISAGKNSIFLYVGHSLLTGMLPWYFALSDETSHLQLLFRLTWSTFVWLLIAHYMALKRLFIKV